MKPASLTFLLCQCADLMTTWLGVSLGAQELNPLGFTWQVIGAKVLLSLAVVHLLNVYAARLRWLIWLPAGVMVVVVGWNAVNIAMII